MPDPKKKKSLLKKIVSKIKRKRRPGVVSQVKKVVTGKDGRSKLKETGAVGVTNSTRSKYRTSNMIKQRRGNSSGVDFVGKPKASVTKDGRGGRTKTKTVSMDTTRPGLRKKKLVGTITKTKRNIITGKEKTTTKNVSYKKARRVLKKMDNKTNKMIKKSIKKGKR
jgi:hypothetical protein